ncbi:hypothetical protein ABE599_03185 [Achromobacter mucicolens]|uniref:hypothetical protein n=1 Tax=Achromobacter TaxID=222 RepID=UPI0014664D3E|nr:MULTISPECIES: hypothetical protein [Achromobacter]MDF2864527.1 hypothetical protein [Achromobacter mucicolens]CAB3816141.1 hypothetical protein LMG26686_00202 [Achromobacter mucicolens]
MTNTATSPATPATASAKPPATAGMARLWLACLAAMGAGLVVDTWRTPAALLASECGAPGTLAQLAWRHAALMPASSAAMALAALLPWSWLPWSRRPGAKTPLASRLLCLILMAIGMVLGARLGVQTAQALGTAPFWGMVLGMTAGMAAALLPVAALNAWRR